MFAKLNGVGLARAASLLFILLATSQDPLTGRAHQEQAGREQQVGTWATSDSSSPTGAKLNVIAADEGPEGLYLMGLFDLHQESSARAPFKCGPLDLEAGQRNARRPLQNLMAFLWAIEQVNADSSLLPGIKLGSIVMDTCSSFLRTNQRLANLLHDSDAGPSGERPLARPSRQLVAIVADQHDWQSVEATVSMASSLGVTSFVTQSRHSKLSELARSYQQAAQSSQLEAGPRGAEIERQSGERMLAEILGIGRMMTPPPPPPPPGSTGQLVAELQGQLRELLQHQTQEEQEQRRRLLMVRMVLSNEILAEALAAFCDRMKWDLVSLVYEPDQADTLDLHDELARQFLLRNTQLALDEPLRMGRAAPAATNSTPAQADDDQPAEQLLARLARKAQFGARAVITLLSAEGARLLQAALAKLRRKLAAAPGEPASRLQLRHLNSIVWLSTADREPYYAYATDSLGLVSVAAGTSSLMPEFKSFYNQHTSASANLTGLANPWWPEYVRAILVRHQKEAGWGGALQLTANECAKWIEPRRSPINEKCRSLSLSSLLELERSALNRAQPQANTTSTGRAGGGAAINSTSTWRRQDETRAGGAKLAKYLAAGWEHNGMSVINSVLAAANGLESLRQMLCPGLASGMCQQMRDLIAPTAPPASHHEDSSSSVSALERPTLSELLHGELARSTFQLADGQMFNLDDGSMAANLAGPAAASLSPLEARSQQQAPGSQLESRVKFYNLRFLRPNLIGFVKFAHYEQPDQLELANESEPLHYGALPGDFSDPVPLAQIQSSCLDETKCLMLGAWLEPAPGGAAGALSGAAHANATNHGSRPLDEEELAEGVNSLFKLDHPLISGGGGGGAGQRVVSSQQLKSLMESGAGEPPLLAAESAEHKDTDKFLRTMRAPPQMAAWPASAFDDEHSHSDDHDKQEPRRRANNKAALLEARQFEVIVLLPLHSADATGEQPEYSVAKSTTTTTTAPVAKCSANIDQAHAFQQLAALAYAQTLVNGRGRSLAASGHSTGAAEAEAEADAEADDNTMNSSQIQNNATRTAGRLEAPPVELSISVIDYCAQIDFMQRRLMGKLMSGAEHDRLVAIVDFDWRASQQVGRVLDKWSLGGARLANKPLHLTIARHTAGERETAHTNSTNTTKTQSMANTLRLNLFPSKAHEIEVLASMLHSLPNFRLLHLIYAGRHEQRDEFIRRANELGICVSKLIFVPEASEPSGNWSAGQWEQQYQRRLALTRQLFEREVFDYSRRGGGAPGRRDDDPEGLSSTRVLVVLASSNARTNQLILEAATESMVNDYVWLTTHEWLDSVELAAEQTAGRSQQASRLPRLFLSTKMETFQGHNFRHFLGSLTPALHAPLPTDWFDEFWQQHFHCRLPIAGAALRAANQSALPLCAPHQRLQPSAIIQDDLVHYTIRAIEALQLALEAQPNGVPAHGEQLARDFRLAFDGRPLARRASSKVQPDKRLAVDLLKPLVGFHLVHRLIADKRTSARPANSRQLVPAESALVRVDVWRKMSLESVARTRSNSSAPSAQAEPSATHLGLRTVRSKVDNTHLSATDRATMTWVRSGREPLLRQELPFSTGPPGSRGGSSSSSSSIKDNDDDLDDGLLQVSNSMARLAAVESRCSCEETCSMCRQQIGQTLALIKQEEARLSLAQGDDAPRAVSSIGANMLAKPQGSLASLPSALDRPSRLDSSFYDSEAEQADGASQLTSRIDRRDPKPTGGAAQKRPGALQDDIQAAASSLFDQRASAQVASEMRRAYSRESAHRAQPSGAGQHSDSLASRHSGALMSVLSLLGILLTVATMTHFYPNMREHQANRVLANKQGSFRSTASSTCNIVRADNDRDELGPQPSGSGSFVGAIMDNLNDYLLLIGLLMLYTINIAFLLPPATVSLCTFRRIGLPVSYTILFGAILARALHIWRQQGRKPPIWPLVNREESAKGSKWSGSPAEGQRQPTSAPARYQLESVHENVELTFESLPQEECDFGPSYQQQEHSVATVSAGGDHHFAAAARQQTDLEQHNPKADIRREEEEEEEEEDHQKLNKREVQPTLQLPLLLLLSQLVVSLVWVARNPPEPTLVLGCWHCSAARRPSAGLYLYEPILTLGQPALLLLAAWFSSILVFKRSSQADERYQMAIRRFLNSQPLTFTLSNSPEYARLKAHQLRVGQQLRESKSLLMANALLVLVWCLALTFVSSQRGIQEAMSSSAPTMYLPSRPTWAPLGHEAADDLGLVYMNLASSAIVFALLFVYRLKLFSRRSPFKRYHYAHIKWSSSPRCLFACCLPASSSSSSSIAASSAMRLFKNSRSPMTFAPAPHQIAGRQQARRFNGSQRDKSASSSFGPSSQERLKLQQLSNTYGTYAATDGDAVEDKFPEPPATTRVHESKGKLSKSKKSLLKRSGKKSCKNQQQLRERAPNTRQLQGDQSSGSAASSRLKLVGGTTQSNQMEPDDFEAASMDEFDTISCAMSLASNSTSQLQGNDLYPIDCSIQLADGAAGNQTARDGQAIS